MISSITNPKVDHHFHRNLFDMLFFFATLHSNLINYLEKLPLPSLSLIKELQQGHVDTLKSAEILMQNGSISSDCVLMVDERYLKKSSQYHGGDYVGEDDNGKLYTSIVVFMIVGVKDSVPYVVKSYPVVSISGEWLSNEIHSCICNLQIRGFKVRAVVSDNHSSNVNAFANLLKRYGNADSNIFVNHPAYLNSLKTYLFYDMVHIIKNVRNNNFPNSKKFVFPSFEFDSFRDQIFIPGGYISWSLFHKLYEKDLELEGNLKKAQNHVSSHSSGQQQAECFSCFSYISRNNISSNIIV